MPAIAIDPTQPIGRLAAARPELIPVLDRFGLDYCCHGQRSLDEACAAAGLAVGEVLAALGAPVAGSVGGERDWTAASMSELADHIEATHHAFARRAFERLDQLAPRVAAAHGAAHPELSQVGEVVAELKAEMLDHMVREERVLFPWLRRLESGSAIHIGPPWSVQRPITCMEHDHVLVAEGFDRLRALTSNYAVPEDACGSYRAMLSLLGELERDTRLHIHKENNILFPAGVRAERARPSRASA